MAIKVYGDTITDEQIEAVNKYMGYEEGDRALTNYAYAFYYNQMQRGLDLCDADRYANLNTVLGYDVGFIKFCSLDSWVYMHGYDLMELAGSEADKELLQRATKETNTKELDYSKWNNLAGDAYAYSYFEKGICVEGSFTKEEER